MLFDLSGAAKDGDRSNKIQPVKLVSSEEQVSQLDTRGYQ
jgi:hypothetical protein